MKSFIILATGKTGFKLTTLSIKCHSANRHVSFIVMLSVVMLNVVMLSVVMLNVVMLCVVMLSVVALNFITLLK